MAFFSAPALTAMMFDDAGGQAVVGPPRVDFLHADVVAEQPQLVDDVLPRALVFRSADGAAADGAGEHLHVRPRVLQRETGRRAGAAAEQMSRRERRATRRTREA